MEKLDRAKAWALLCQYNPSESLQKHGLAVEAVMRYFAKLEQQDADYWGIVGLLHDVDYEQYPQEHCVKAVDILKENGYDDAFIHAVVSHGYQICSDVEPTHRMEQILYTTDELTGLITACAYMRPSKSVMDLEVSSVRKKYKSKNFAAGVDRSVIEKGAAMLGMELADVIFHTILGMQESAEAIGLLGDWQG